VIALRGATVAGNATNERHDMNDDTLKLESAHRAVRLLGCMLRVQICVLHAGGRTWHSLHVRGLGKMAHQEFTQQFTPQGEMRGLSASELLTGQSFKYLSILSLLQVVRPLESDTQ